MSRKLTDAQRSYTTLEAELLAIIESLLKWEDRLLGRRIRIVTDHEALKWLKTQSKLSRRLTRWMQYLSRFDYDIEYQPGYKNIVADSLSRYFEQDNAGEVHRIDEYSAADVRLDPEGED